MRHSPRTFLPLLVAALLLILHGPIRREALIILRWPFTVTKGAVHALLLLPRLASLTEENSQLRAALMQREVEVAQWREYARQDQQLRALSAAAGETHGLVATVIGRSIVPTQQTVLLNKGARDGLTLDLAVVDASGVIGRLVELHPTTALVILLTDADSRVAAMVERSRDMGLLVGRPSGACELIYLDVHADVQKDDRVVTAGLGGSFPKGLWLGTVRDVVRDEVSGSARASVEPAAKFSRLEEVFCLSASLPAFRPLAARPSALPPMDDPSTIPSR